MRGSIRIKRTLRRVSGWSEQLLHLLTRDQSLGNACILYYHRVADVDFIDSEFDDRNVSSAQFDEHLETLTKYADVVPLPELRQRLESGVPRAKPLICITFDDGYANFRSHALPLLLRYNLPATLSIATGYVGSRAPAPFDSWALKNVERIAPQVWRILNWKEIEECVSSGLVTLAAHSHLHLRGDNCTPSELKEEVYVSADILRSRFGSDHAQIYAYPYGNSYLGHVPKVYEELVRAAGFTVGLTTDVGLTSINSNHLRLPRIEAHGQDSASTLRAKASGAIAPLYLNEMFHKLVGWGRFRGTSNNDQVFAE